VELLLSPISATFCLDPSTLLLFQEHVVVKGLLSLFLLESVLFHSLAGSHQGTSQAVGVHSLPHLCCPFQIVSGS
jgi:hypothetical protein